MGEDNLVLNDHLASLLAELAECEVAAHQVHHGPSAEALLSCCLDCIYLRQTLHLSCIPEAFVQI